MLEYARAVVISLGTREADKELMGKMDSAKQPTAADAIGSKEALTQYDIVQFSGNVFIFLLFPVKYVRRRLLKVLQACKAQVLLLCIM